MSKNKIIGDKTMKWKHPLAENRPPYYSGRPLLQGPLELIAALGSILTDERKIKIEKMLKARTYDFCFILDHLVNQGNINAIIRSCESFGHSWLHLIEGESHKKINRTTQGAHHWMETVQWEMSVPAILKLKELGYKIMAASLSDKAVAMNEINFKGKVAVILGNEEIGSQKDVLSLADCEFYIPTVGMTKSFNVSVAASIIAHQAFVSRMNNGVHSGNLDDDFMLTGRARAYLHSGDFRTTESILEHYKLLPSRHKNSALGNE